MTAAEAEILLAERIRRARERAERRLAAGVDSPLFAKEPENIRKLKSCPRPHDLKCVNQLNPLTFRCSVCGGEVDVFE